MTDKPTPTDAEILDAAEDFRSQYTHGGTTFDEFDEIGFARAVLAKWGTPQPVVREPRTDAQIAEMMRDTWGCASIAPRHALEFARTVERAHGITQKGGD